MDAFQCYKSSELLGRIHYHQFARLWAYHECSADAADDLFSPPELLTRLLGTEPAEGAYAGRQGRKELSAKT